MKKTMLLLFAATATLLSTFTGCQKKGCDSGFEGDNCEAVNLKFAGTYNGIMYFNSGGSQTEQIVINAGTTPTSIIIYYGEAITATVSGNSITIPTQTFNTSWGWFKFYGNGTLNNNALNLNIYYDDSDSLYDLMNFQGSK